MTRQYGDPDGHGRYGILDTDQDGRLVCHECGRTYQHLATHIRQAHETMPADYREAHGLGLSTRLVAESVSQRLSDAWESSDKQVRLDRLAEVRNPHRARRESLGRPWRVGAAAGRAEAARARAQEIAPHQVAELGDWYDIPGWVKRFRALQARDGVAIRAVARALDVSQSSIHSRLRRYPEGG